MKYFQVGLAVAGAVVMSAVSAHALPVVWSVNGHSYEAFVTQAGQGWGDAKAAAEGMGGYLAVLTTAEENSWVYDNVVLPAFGTGNGGDDGVQAWLGAARSGEGGWAWVTGEAFAWENFADGEPNNAGNGELALTINRFGTAEWNDEGAWPQGVKGFIVEFGGEPAGVPDGGSTLVLAGLAMIGLAGLRRKL